MVSGDFMKFWGTAVVLLATFLVSISASATLISLDDPIFGVGAFTLDTTTGLEWLDVNLSTNRSVNDVSATLGAGGDFAGLRYAVPNEVYGLFVAAGIPDVPGRSTANFAPAQALMDLIGHTSIDGVGRDVFAVTNTVPPGETTAVARVVLNGIGGGTNSPGPLYIADFGGSQGPQAAWPEWGNWLVRDSAVVPEPSALLLFVLGLSGLVVYKRQRRRGTF